MHARRDAAGGRGNLRTLALAAVVFLALVASPLGEFSTAGTAAAYVCPITDDPVEDLECRLNQCGRFDPKRPLEWLKPRMCPD